MAVYSLVAQRRDDNKVNASSVRRYMGSEKLTILILLITTESRNVIFVSRYRTISTGNFAFTAAFAAQSITDYVVNMFNDSHR